MRIIKLPKKNGAYRTIYAPDKELKGKCRAALHDLEAIIASIPASKYHHGFLRSKSPVTNALEHKGWEFTIKFDIEDFFDSVTHEKVVRALPVGRTHHLPEEWFPDGAARQGLPTSPLLAVLALMPATREIEALNVRGRLGKPFTFTIYADDISVSFHRQATAAWLLKEIPAIVERHGFKINPAKTKLQCSRAGRRMITGVAVDDAIHVPRGIKRKLRAAKHQMGRNPWAKRQHRGLQEWALLKPPAGYSPPSTTTIGAAVTRLAVKTIGVARRLAEPWTRKFT